MEYRSLESVEKRRQKGRRRFRPRDSMEEVMRQSSLDEEDTEDLSYTGDNIMSG